MSSSFPSVVSAATSLAIASFCELGLLSAPLVNFPVLSLHLDYLLLETKASVLFCLSLNVVLGFL